MRPIFGSKSKPLTMCRGLTATCGTGRRGLCPLTAARDLKPTSVERCYGRFKEEVSGCSIQVRGPDKVTRLAMFDIITLFATSCLNSLVAECQRTKIRIARDMFVQNVENQLTRWPPVRLL